MLSTVFGLVATVFAANSVGDRAVELLQASPPADSIDLVFCQTDLDCTRLGDTGAQCDTASGTCQCSPTFLGEVCYPEPENPDDLIRIVGIFVLTFPDANCEEFLNIESAIADFNTMFEQLYAQSRVYYLCGSINMAVEVGVDARNITTFYQSMLEDVNTLSANEKYTSALQYTPGGIKVSWHTDPGNGIPTCIVLDSNKTLIIENVCRALECRSGYVKKDVFVNGKVVASCELITETDDAALTDATIAAIVFSVLLILAIVAFLLWHFMCRDDGEDGIRVNANDPFADHPSESTRGPYGNKDGDSDGESARHAVPYSADDKVVDEDVAV
eukprot:TRINITY_DN11243_c1_g1_i1.p1 TRINITY_DN11243_c1_g1~~TRINITY_DN11243_c1_g1_i1.p1  ORF type:complete len:330 (+),score=57.59 TRINITY_DN11243_c1_g1_i1:74-1063(+)